MLTQTTAACLQVTSIGRYASDLLLLHRQVEVMIALSKAVYLRAPDGEILWLVQTGGPMHRRCLQTGASLAGLPVGTILSPGRDDTQAGPGGLLDISQAKQWDEPAFTHQNLTPAPNLDKALQSVLHLLLLIHLPAGLGKLLPAYLAGESIEGNLSLQGKTPSLSPLTLHAVSSIIHCLGQQDTNGLPKAAASLVGMGEGLTPSGDDFLGGLLFSRFILERIHPDVDGYKWNYPDFIDNCKHLTNEISFTLLQDHTRGHTLEPLHLLGSGLLAGRSPDTLLAPAEDLIGVGHSTGWDLLTGFSIGMLSAGVWDQASKSVERMSYGYQTKD